MNSFLDLLNAFEVVLKNGRKSELESILRGTDSQPLPAGAAELLISEGLRRLGVAADEGDRPLSRIMDACRLAGDAADIVFPDTGRVRFGLPDIAVTVLEDTHRVGKRMVLAALKAAGLMALDYDRVTVPETVRRMRMGNTRIILVSAATEETAMAVKGLRQHMDYAAVDARIIVGGSAFQTSPDLWKRVGADAMGTSASEAVRLVTSYLDKEAKNRPPVETASEQPVNASVMATA